MFWGGFILKRVLIHSINSRQIFISSRRGLLSSQRGLLSSRRELSNPRRELKNLQAVLNFKKWGLYKTAYVFLLLSGRKFFEFGLLFVGQNRFNLFVQLFHFAFPFFPFHFGLKEFKIQRLDLFFLLVI